MEFQYQNETFTYCIERKRVKNINARMKSDGVIYVSAPAHIPAERIQAFLEEHGKQFKQMRDHQAARRAAAPDYTDGSEIPYLGRQIRLRYFSAPRPTILEDDVLSVYAKDAATAFTSVRQWKMQQCIPLYRKINQEVCAAFRGAGFQVPLAYVEVKDMSSRWGSCTAAKGRISMNLRLMQYPIPCIYGVFYHEYTHFLYQDHSQHFYALLQQMYPEYDRWDALLK